ncbi:hypothetical protein ISF_05573 [Cordyceps fumosorosea ARSEF 2679]|uniref:AB hydrolase-1 domain-containing protein n=1 Tax=Cordyceps fumosorosea (strain ARSEF 2679) TaxID=1081104 RepID=A0A167UE47_CORFA|nr:hypothetical protein ISF_05573 [Cordyceps fumosorosea ARSEF 2679]OAA61494.1 hypothetical protein ISF_05573 [Cordyceps fumosorosea ARSEF 2679]
MADTLSSQEFGDGLPVLIIHGWELSAAAEQADFEPVLAKLPPGLRRIYVDLPGTGATPAAGLRDLDERLRAPRARFLVVGTSCGGYLARAPWPCGTRTGWTGCCCACPLVEPEDGKRDMDAFGPLVEGEALMKGVSAEDKALLGTSLVVQTAAYVAALKRKILDVYRPATEAADKGGAAAHPGGPGARYPRATFAVLDRATHGLPVDETGVFEALVGDWISRVLEWRRRQQQQQQQHDQQAEDK